MSHSMSITTHRSRLPKVEDWNRTIAAAGFDLVLDEFNWDSHSGYLPARLLQAHSGFELYVEPEEQPCRLFVIRRTASDKINVSAVLHSSFLETTAALVTFAVLQEFTGGEYRDDSDTFLTPTELQAEAWNAYHQCRILLARLDDEGSTAWDHPALGPHESRESRLRLLESMAAARDLVKEGDAYRLHKLKAESLRKELDNSST